MAHHIQVGSYRLAMIDKVSIHESVELLADTAQVILPSSEYNKTLEVEQKLHRGDRVKIAFGYEEYNVPVEFQGYVQTIQTDGGNVTILCEDDLFKFRVGLPDAEYKHITLDALLRKVIGGVGGDYKLDCSYSWTYDSFVVNHTTGYDILKKIQDECMADIYLREGTLHVHAPAEKTGPLVKYDFACNVEKENLTYRRSNERKVKVVVKALMPDGNIQRVESGSEGGDRVEITSPTCDLQSMKQLCETEGKRRSYGGYDGNIDTWLVPFVKPGYKAALNDRRHPEKNGTYFVQSVTTEFSAQGGKRKVELGIRLA